VLSARGRAAGRKGYENPASNRAWLASFMDVSVKEVDQALGLPFFGQAWDSLEKASPKLSRTPVPVVDLPL